MGQAYFSTQPDQKTKIEIEQPKEVEIDYDVESPRFSVQNIKELENGINHLNEHGYAVFCDIFTTDEVHHSIDLLWNHLESLKHPYHIKRDDPQTWDKKWPGMPFVGLLNDSGFGQSEFMWFIRGKPTIKKVFSHIWESDELFVSLDGAGCFRNWHFNENWKTLHGWFHCDQNPFRKPNRCSIQGLVSLTDSDKTTGGFVIVPGSQNYFTDLQAVNNEKKIIDDYVRIPPGYPLFEKLPTRLVQCKAGDLIVWDSRCIHCNVPATVLSENHKQIALLRIVAYICMSPVSMFTPNVNAFKNLEEYRQLREAFVRKRHTSTHWPLELEDGGRELRDKLPLKLNRFQHSLIVGTNVEGNDVQAQETEEEIEF